MGNTYFQFKEFIIHHDRCAMKVTTDSCLFGAWCSITIQQSKSTLYNVLDIGSGTGLLSLMIAQKNHLLIDAVEIDKNAAEQAKDNVVASPWRKNIEVIHADILTWKAKQKYDFIVSNPPFYESDLKSTKKEKNLAHHHEGLKLEEFFTLIDHLLAEKGKFFLLLPAKREKDLIQLLDRHTFHLHQKTTVKQSVNHNVFRIMIGAGREKETEVQLDEVIIKDLDNAYTPTFFAFLKDYYLYL